MNEVQISGDLNKSIDWLQENGKTYFQPWKWLKDPKRTPWGQRKSRGKIKGKGFDSF